jgi:hypothetical protein
MSLFEPFQRIKFKEERGISKYKGSTLTLTLTLNDLTPPHDNSKIQQIPRR